MDNPELSGDTLAAYAIYELGCEATGGVPMEPEAFRRIFQGPTDRDRKAPAPALFPKQPA